MAGYEGMQWFKCDFQVQTPEDGAHWADADTRLPEPRRAVITSTPNEQGMVQAGKFDEQRLQEVARIYLRRCHELGLEVIGVTDHNFSQKTEPREWFLTHVVEQNKPIADTLGRKPLHIFPGFEVDVGYHVLCLFEPAKKLSHVWRVNRILCKLGLDEHERFRQGRPMPLRRMNAYVSLKDLIDLVQEDHGGIVIAAHADQKDGILGDPRNIEDYRNKKLLALEVTANPPSKRVLDIVDGRDRAWARSDCHPAYVMSSDAKSLKADQNGSPTANALGYRHSWVKMSKPSIESLRQAFLDPLSRIALLGSRPSDVLQHPRITQIGVKGAKFLDDQEVQFSEMLNCVIGGRGSGKSSLLEYMRFAIGLDDPVSGRGDEEDPALARKRRQLRESLGPEAEIRVSFQVANGVADTLVYLPSRPVGSQRKLQDRDVADLNTVLRQLQVQFFGQGELSRMTSGSRGQAQVLSLIDNACGAPLIELKARERDLRADLKTLFQSARDASRLREEVNIAIQEAAELERQLTAREAVKDYSKRNQAAMEARRYLGELRQADGPILVYLENALASLKQPLPSLPETSDRWPTPDWFSQAHPKVASARKDLANAMEVALAHYKEAMTRTLGEEASHPVIEGVEAVQKAFRAACAERGIQEGDIARMQELEDSRQEKLRQVEVKRARLEEVNRAADKLPAALGQLHELWRSQFELRGQTAASIQENVASQTVKVRIDFMRDAESFRNLWQRLAPRDGRGKLARRWEELGADVFESWKNRGIEPTPWETVMKAKVDAMVVPYFYGEMMEDLQPAMVKHLGSDDVSLVWEEVRTTRVGDGIEVELLRNDGSVAGAMSGNLSEGQRNTVLLNLMLARGEGPIVIDQPEDELDSSFIYRTLVTDLRAAKLKRQIIVATHNANLPVNADAEQICALEARDGRGRRRASGGLDRKGVAEAVLDIMEGSEQAFRRRSEKYHF